MRSAISLIFCCITFFQIQAQDYFQQDVNYIINAELDDQSHVVQGDMQLEYTNNSSTTLNEIYIHLWANAFKDNNSYYSNDNLKHGMRKFYFAKDFQRGGYTSIDFKINNESVLVENYEGYEDVVKLVLAQPIGPSESVTIDCNFELKVPHFFSRLGRAKDRYHLMHWYPRVAVYDKSGWHPMHYATIGEFYGEYGSYQVNLSVPMDYRLGFTGSGVAELSNNLEDGNTRWSINAENVHDFAWVASKHFEVEFEKVNSIDGREINLTILKQPGDYPQWDFAMQYLKESFSYYEKNVGVYPYGELTLLQGRRNGHRNMEYPGLILVTDRGSKISLDYYINHELGHEWFFGGLGFNERDEPWLDEGLTTFYEHRYTLGKVGKPHYSDQFSKVIKDTRQMRLNHAVVQTQINTGFSQAINLPDGEISMANHAIRAYEQSAASYLYLEEYLGKALFDESMKSFYAQWKFKHPNTEDLQIHFENSSGKSLDWFFNDLLVGNKRLDYKLASVQSNGNNHSISIENLGEIEIPIVIDGYKNGQRVFSKWVEKESDAYQLEVKDIAVDKISIDGENLLFDVNRENNHSTGFFSNLKLSLPNRVDGSDERNIFALPLAGYNSTDGGFLGLGWTNSTIPPGKFQLRGFSAYGLRSKSVVGGGEASYSIYPKSERIRKYQFGVSGKSFHFADIITENIPEDVFLRYTKFQPFVKVFYKDLNNEKRELNIGVRSVYTRNDFAFFSSPTEFEIRPRSFLTTILTLETSRARALAPSNTTFNIEYSGYKNIFDEAQNYLKITGELNQDVFFATDKAFSFRLFGGSYLLNSQSKSSNYNDDVTRGSLSMFYQGFSDYLFDEPFVNRGDQNSSLFDQNQIAIRDGAFKNAFGSAQGLGQSNTFLCAVNLKTDLPFNLPKYVPLKLFGDFGYYGFRGTNEDELKKEFLFSAGFSLDYKLFQVHLPLFYSDQIDQAYGGDRSKIYQKITFSFHLNDFLPWKIIDDKRF